MWTTVQKLFVFFVFHKIHNNLGNFWNLWYNLFYKRKLCKSMLELSVQLTVSLYYHFVVHSRITVINLFTEFSYPLHNFCEQFPLLHWQIYISVVNICQKTIISKTLYFAHIVFWPHIINPTLGYNISKCILRYNSHPSSLYIRASQVISYGIPGHQLTRCVFWAEM